MPLLLAPFLAFALGALAAFAHGGALGARRLSIGRQLVATFAVLSLWPAVLYFAFAETGWSLLYLVEPRRVPATALLTAASVVAVLFPVGYEAGARTIGAPRAHRIAIVAGPTVAAASVAAALLGRTRSMGQAGVSADAAATRSDVAIVAVDVLLAAAFLLLFRELERLERPVGRASS